MKVKHDFITNSSSSSYIIIGTISKKAVDELKEKEDVKSKLKSKDYGIIQGKNVSFFGTGNNIDNIYIAGIDVLKSLKAGARVPDMIKWFQNKMHECYDIFIPIDEIELIWGEWEY
jgi:hypothetical protein